MKNFLVLLIASPFLVLSQIPTKDWQINSASLAAPEGQRAGATILGYNSEGELVTLREGSNELICLADDPNRDGFSASAYHKDLEPYMFRGRELVKEGKDFKERIAIREEEVKAGTLKMPERALLYVLSGKINPDSKEIEDQYLRFVVYIPYATAESTGLPLSPTVPGGPWIMDPGTHKAHIMINPPKN